MRVVKVNGRFIALLLSGIALTAIIRLLGLPAAFLFGPLVASAVFAVRGWLAFRAPNAVYIAGQAFIGTALGAGFSPKTLFLLPQHAGIFIFAVVFILLTSLLNGWLLARFTRLDAGTSFLGTMPGGAGAMAAMSDSLKANTQLVTAIQCTRLLVILGVLACSGPLFRHFAHPAGTGAGLIMMASSPATGWHIVALVGLAASGWLAGMFTKIPAGSVLVPTMLYMFLAMRGIELGACPWPLLAGAYLVMGMQIGGRFHPSTVAMVRDVIFPVVSTTLILLTASVALAWIVAREMGINFVSGYLAATPGGLDSVAAVATELHVDTTMIVAMHMVRLLCVLLFGPWLVRGCARGMSTDAPAGAEEAA